MGSTCNNYSITWVTKKILTQEKHILVCSSFKKIFGPIIFFVDLHMKVVIPTSYLRGKKKVFLWPRSQYEVYDHKIVGEKTPDDPFQVSNASGDKPLSKFPMRLETPDFALKTHYNL